MKLLRLSSSKFFIIASLWLLSLGSSHSGMAQVQWAGLLAHFDQPPRTMFVDSTDSTLYLGGTFRTVNGQPDTAIIGIRPNGSLRHLPNPKFESVNVIAKWNGKLLAGGFGGLAEYNGTSWQKIIPGDTAVVWSLYPYQGKLLVGGTFVSSNGYAGVLKEWNGITLTHFKGLDSVIQEFSVNAIAEYNGDLVIGGNIIPYTPVDPRFKDIMRWTGTSWQPLSSTGLPGGGLDFVSDMIVLNGDLYVAGLFHESNGSPGNSVAKWDGTQWHRLGGGLGPLGTGVNDLEVQGDTLILCGTFDIADGKPTTNLARYWNGHWCSNDSPVPDVSLCAKNWFGNVVVGGVFLALPNIDTFGRLAKITSWGDCFAQAAGVPFTQSPASTLGLIASPNPTSDELRVEFSLPAAGIVTLTLSDATGRTILSRSVKGREGLNRTAVDLRGVPAGLYLIQLTTNTGHEAIKIVKR